MAVAERFIAFQREIQTLLRMSKQAPSRHAKFISSKNIDFLLLMVMTRVCLPVLPLSSSVFVYIMYFRVIAIGPQNNM